MKFGKQLQLGIYEQWRDYYIQYDRLKRIIKRKKFLADKAAEGQEKIIKNGSFVNPSDATSKSGCKAAPPVPTESTPLMAPNAEKAGSNDDNLEDSEFFP
eukprot:gene43227-52839_t